jgi:chemotaxis protein MotB
MKRAHLATLGLLCLPGFGLSAVGCVAREEYDRVEFARRVAVQRATELEREIADERAQRQSVESERNAARRELDTKTALTENLNAENRRLGDTLDKTHAYAEEVLKKGFQGPSVIEVTRLPADLDRALKEFASRYPEQVEYLPERGMVRWKSDLTFALGSDVVRDQASAPLQEFARIVTSNAQEFEVVIAGHTDNVPIRASNREHKSNWHLSTHRAIAVMYALNRYGVSFDKLGCMGFGEHRPRESNPASGGNEKNRRVEIFLIPARESFGTVSAG